MYYFIENVRELRDYIYYNQEGDLNRVISFPFTISEVIKNIRHFKLAKAGRVGVQRKLFQR